ncbi:MULTISPECIES: XdhC/CoxI family protein [Rhodomicrobium]|uniref:XdhC family protein n=1 Tax=Rhodomicrobium TaxID=1068 RepID=UPI000B4B5D40|nr:MULTISPECIES: XdhC/CoxI family protein [Rhodomicrobium]
MSIDPNESVESFCRNWDGAAPYVRATIVRTEGATAAKSGAKAIVTAEAEIIGWLGGGCVRGAVLKAAREAIAAGAPRLIRVRPKEAVGAERDADGVPLYASHCPSKGSADIFIEPVIPKRPLVIIGGSYVAQALADLAGPLSFHIVKAQANAEALADQPGLRHGFIVVATQGSGDFAGLSAALATSAPYVAFVGSPAKVRAMRARLLAGGMDETALARLRAPAGLAIGAETPAEIAVSILAQIISLSRSAVREAARS